MATIQKACAKLDETLAKLGDSPDQIAAKLTEGGYKGHCGNARHCPVARYLRFQGFSGIAVSGAVVTTAKGSAITPSPLRQFVSTFDSGGYKELVAPSLTWVAWDDLRRLIMKVFSWRTSTKSSRG